MSAAIIPGIHPKKVSTVTIKTDPHPLSKTAKGGNNIDKTALHKLTCSKLQLKFGENVKTQKDVPKIRLIFLNFLFMSYQILLFIFAILFFRRNHDAII